jgi:hypothetical protein
MRSDFGQRCGKLRKHMLKHHAIGNHVPTGVLSHVRKTRVCYVVVVVPSQPYYYWGCSSCRVIRVSSSVARAQFPVENLMIAVS